MKHLLTWTSQDLLITGSPEFEKTKERSRWLIVKDEKVTTCLKDKNILFIEKLNEYECKLFILTSFHESYKAVQDGKLSLEGLHPEDAVGYSCAAKNKHGNSSIESPFRSKSN